MLTCRASYPLELWWAISCFIALVSLLHLVSLLMSYCAKRFARSSLRIQDKDADEKGSTPLGVQLGPNGAARALRNVPSATLSGIQKIFFRIRTPFHRLHRMNMAEIVVTLGYLAGKKPLIGST
jgi:hypothetical protein